MKKINLFLATVILLLTSISNAFAFDLDIAVIPSEISATLEIEIEDFEIEENEGYEIEITLWDENGDYLAIYDIEFEGLYDGYLDTTLYIVIGHNGFGNPLEPDTEYEIEVFTEDEDEYNYEDIDFETLQSQAFTTISINWIPTCKSINYMFTVTNGNYPGGRMTVNIFDEHNQLIYFYGYEDIPANSDTTLSETLSNLEANTLYYIEFRTLAGNGESTLAGRYSILTSDLSAPNSEIISINPSNENSIHIESFFGATECSDITTRLWVSNALTGEILYDSQPIYRNAGDVGFMEVDLDNLPNGTYTAHMETRNLAGNQLTGFDQLQFTINKIISGIYELGGAGLTIRQSQNSIEIISQDTYMEISLINLNGQIIETKMIMPGVTTFDLSSLPSSMYLLKSVHEGAVYSHKFMKK